MPLELQSPAQDWGRAGLFPRVGTGVPRSAPPPPPLARTSTGAPQENAPLPRATVGP